MPELLEVQIQKLVDTVTDASSSIHVITGAGMRSLADMAHREVSMNQCRKVAQAVTALAVIPEAKTSLVGVSSPRGSHYATLIAREDTEVIVDFTASQFNPRAPFPMVMDKDAWKIWVQRYLGASRWVE